MECRYCGAETDGSGICWNCEPPGTKIITRHQPLVDWLAARGITGEVIAQATADDVRGQHVYGVLPLWLAAEAESVTEVSMPDITLEQRRRNAAGDMSVEEMDAAGAHLVTYCVTKI